jgi:hypothetical protein
MRWGRRDKRTAGGGEGTHNERFAALQGKYLETRDSRYLGEMYLVCAELAANYIRKYARARGLRLDTDTLAHDSAVYVTDQYLKKPGFRISRVSAYIHFGCVKTLFRDSGREQRETSYNDIKDYIYEMAEGHPEEAPEHPAAALFRRGASVPDTGNQPAPAYRQGLLFEEETL